MSTPELFAGIDVGASVVHGALVRRAGRRCDFVGAWSGPPVAVAEWCGAAVRVAVDAPGGLSAGAHLDDFSVAPKFRTGRCSEVPIPGWPPVPWVTPGSGSAAAVPGWMVAGFELWNGLCGYGTIAVETFPAGAFYRLNGRRWPPPKSSSPGRACRLALLSGLVDLPPAAAGWGHDQIDAVVAAVVAAFGHPAPHHCPRPDGSVMWVMG